MARPMNTRELDTEVCGSQWLGATSMRSCERSDGEIVRKVTRRLEWSLQVPQDGIEVTAQNGWVTLTGAVDWRYQKLAAESAAREIDGVCGVTNLIRIRPSHDDADVREKMMDLACTWQHR